MQHPLKFTLDYPLISDDQWKFIREVLARDEIMMLVVVCELPLVWESKEGGKAKSKGDGIKVGGAGNHIQVRVRAIRPKKKIKNQKREKKGKREKNANSLQK